MNGPSVAEQAEKDGANLLQLNDEIDNFIPGVQRWYKNVFGKPPEKYTEKFLRILFSKWNIFLQLQKDIEGISAIGSSHIPEYINEFIHWLQNTLDIEGISAIGSSHIPEYINEFIHWLQNTLDVHLTDGNKKWIRRWLSRWNMFLQARSGQAPVSRFQICLTFLGILVYVLDISSDISTVIYHMCNRNLWYGVLTLFFIYAPVTINTARKWIHKQLRWSSSLDKLRYFGSLIVNWPDLKQYWKLCYLEWKLFISPESNAYLVAEWQGCRLNVAYAKFVEGLYEACPQAILQLWLLFPDLEGNITLTDYLRIASTCLSMCTAGAALVNFEKFERTRYNIQLVPNELFMLHVWVVPVTVSRLLSIVLLLTVHLYWGLACVALHLLLFSVYWYKTRRFVHTGKNILFGCLESVWFLISPFVIGRSITLRRVFHAIHFLCNTSVTALWALVTPLVCMHQSMYVISICIFNGTMFGIGLLGWILHEKYWPSSYSQPWHKRRRPRNFKVYV